MFTKWVEKLVGVRSSQSVKRRSVDLNVSSSLEESAPSREETLAGVKLGSKYVFDSLVSVLKNDHGVEFESLLCALGALAGYACQANLRAQALAKGMKETAAFDVIEAGDGKPYYFGDPLNVALVNDSYSVWALTSRAALDAGAKDLPDLNEIIQHTSRVLGTEHFGVPRLPHVHKPCNSPAEFVRVFWPILEPRVKKVCPKPSLWQLVFCFAIQDAIVLAKSRIDPALAAKIVMESAVPMSKIELACH